MNMKNFHATITFVAKSDKAAEEFRERLQRVVNDVDLNQIDDIKMDFQEEIVYARRDIGRADEAIARLSFDDIFVPKSDSF